VKLAVELDDDVPVSVPVVRVADVAVVLLPVRVVVDIVRVVVVTDVVDVAVELVPVL